MQKFFNNVLFVAFVGALLFIFRAPLESRFALLMQTYLPCREPITYSLGTFDTRFGLSKTDFLQAVKEAEVIWEKPIGKELFSYQQNGDLKINLSYDNRQAVTVKLQALGVALDDNRASYDLLRAKYATLNTNYEQEKTRYASLVQAFNDHQDAYNAEVLRSNTHGGAKPAEYARLNAERQSLADEVQTIKELERILNADADTINLLVAELNRVAKVLNLNAGVYNQVGASRGQEFEEGIYQSGPNGATIDIYQYDNRAKLVRVLAHELGHALGLEHVDEPKAIMYQLNQGTNEKLTESDLVALKTRCGIR